MRARAARALPMPRLGRRCWLVAAAAGAPLRGGEAALCEPRVPPAGELLEFERHGHVATRGLLTPAEFAGVAADLREVAFREQEAAARHAVWSMEEAGLGDMAPPFLQTFNPHRRHAAARQLALSPLLAATAAALLGVRCVRLYQTSLFRKRPDDDVTSWHADLWTAPLMTNSFVTMWLPLRGIGARGDSPLFFQSKTHRDLARAVYVEDMEELGIDPDNVPAPGEFGSSHAPLREGDATWHHGWTIHGAPEVSSDAGERFAYTASYFADGAMVPCQAPQIEDRPSYDDWIEEATPGRPAQHELLPIAYTAP